LRATTGTRPVKVFRRLKHLGQLILGAASSVDVLIGFIVADE